MKPKDILPPIMAIAALLLQVDLQAQSIDFYVSPQGSDQNTGTAAQPLQTMAGARDIIRGLAQRGSTPITVNFADGIYPVEEMIVFWAEDSGSVAAPITYRAMAGAKPVFSGSKTLPHWTRLTDEAMLHRLTPQVRDKIWVADLRAAGITDLGDPTELGKRPDLICNDELQTLARWPNEAFTHSGMAKGEGLFEYADSRMNRWVEEEDIRLHGYWRGSWLDEDHKVARLDTVDRLVYIQPPYRR